MKVAHETRRDSNNSDTLDLATIRRRVAGIKNRWSPEEARARALEGARRRRELDAMVSDFLAQAQENNYAETPSSRDNHGLSLVG